MGVDGLLAEAPLLHFERPGGGGGGPGPELPSCCDGMSAASWGGMVPPLLERCRSRDDKQEEEEEEMPVRERSCGAAATA